MESSFTVPCITIDTTYQSIFSEETYPKTVRGGMLLTDRIDAQNLRLRESNAGYKANWHVAGDPTLIIVQQGILRITLQDQSFRDFKSGDAFIAKDYLPDGIKFDATIHGHCAEVIGNESLKAIHIKLAIVDK